MPVCSPAFVEKHGPFTSADMLTGVPLIHDDSFSSRGVMPSWADWFAAAGVRDADVSRGLRLNSAYHALDATVEGAGMLLAHDALAYDDLRTGRLVAPFDLTLPSGRRYCFVCARKRRESANVRAFLAWLKEEAAAVDWSKRAPRSQFAARGGIGCNGLNCANAKSPSSLLPARPDMGSPSATTSAAMPG
jgi:LysR family transcriptional regulator, glycine cleavage system transcriptional activator